MSSIPTGRSLEKCRLQLLAHGDGEPTAIIVESFSNDDSESDLPKLEMKFPSPSHAAVVSEVSSPPSTRSISTIWSMDSSSQAAAASAGAKRLRNGVGDDDATPRSPMVGVSPTSTFNIQILESQRSPGATVAPLTLLQAESPPDESILESEEHDSFANSNNPPVLKLGNAGGGFLQKNWRGIGQMFNNLRIDVDSEHHTNDSPPEDGSLANVRTQDSQCSSVEYVANGGLRLDEWVIDPDGIKEFPSNVAASNKAAPSHGTSPGSIQITADADVRIGEKKKELDETAAVDEKVREFSLEIGDIAMISPSGNDSKMRSTDFVQFGSVIGHGNSGTVVKALNIKDFRVYALKSIRVTTKKDREQIKKELTAFHSLACPGLISFHGAFFDSGQVTLVLEYMNRGSLQNVIDNFGAVTDEATLKRISLMVLLGLEQMHSKRLFHRDIKPGNILLDSSGNCKISDFGIARQLEDSEESARTVLGTRLYMSPERMVAQAYGCSSDIWSFGLMMHTLAMGIYPYDKRNHLELSVAEDPSPKLPRGRFSIGFRNFLDKCLEKDPEKRHTAEELLNHDFLKEVDISQPYEWPWEDASRKQDTEDLVDIAGVLGKAVFGKRNLYKRSKENSMIFSNIAESLNFPTSSACVILERNLPLKSFASSPFH
eukprot:TRINITY_DN4962_c0_g1_i1.p1 TRINITY_DN4962_c0_g1~~TRINITY_DN4962_c0_g1_i1.p1  ORF type:complete len:658 (-),score=144.84 TRINITY_DN4962_c0_g1_i1:866-2839(-)